jgi:hypothetical protein
MNNLKSSAFFQKYSLSMALFASWILYLLILDKYVLWAYVGVPQMNPLFADLHAILSANECHTRGLNVFFSNPCDVLARVHVYGSIWLSLSALGLGSPHLFVMGLVLNSVFLVLVVYLLKPTSAGEFFKCCLILFSPAVTLGVERGNNDLLIFILLALSAALFTIKNKIANISGLVIIYFSTLLKIYPSILLAATLVFARRNIKEFILLAACAIGLAALWLLPNIDEILLLSNIVPKPTDHYATGARAMLLYIGRPYPWVLTIHTAWWLAGFISLIALCSIALASRLKTLELQQPQAGFTYVLYMFGLTILFFTYAINSNYDYRWIFFIFLMPQLFEIQRYQTKGTLAHRMVTLGFVCVAIVIWTEMFRSTRLFGSIHFNIFFNIGRSTFSIELFQQFIKEFAAWVLFVVLFAFAIKILPKQVA